MAIISPSTLQCYNPIKFFFSSPSPPIWSSLKLHAPPHFKLNIPRATDDDDAKAEEVDQTQTELSSSDADSFESRLTQLRLRNKSGTGKKAEQRKTRKGKKGGSSSSGAGLYLPPVPLKEPVSEGLKVEFGFSPYSERVNGRLALIGLTALLLVELATGKGLFKYHSPAVVLIQVYFMAAASALFLKYDKEKLSVWP